MGSQIASGSDSAEQGAAKRVMQAAQYVRMSTEHQKYSTANQAAAIARYAEQRGIEIVRTYADEGKSGLRLDGRDALKQLIDDVQNGQANYAIVLVYDVSRWGRFQDADESAYYEYICRRAGISVQYCAEQFENDGSPVSTIVKGVKRAMAGEYSRELSAKVFAGQCRLVELGFRQGGRPGFGLRRQLIDQNRQPKEILRDGEQKSLQTDRVILVPGPPEELSVVRRIYRMFVEEGKSESEIAAVLNAQGCHTDLARHWTRGTVHQLLTNEKYIGNNVFNRVSFKLKKKRILNRPDMWIRANGAFEAIVSPELFQTAQSIIAARDRRYSDEEMLDRLRQLYRDRGLLSGILIDETDGMPSSHAYHHRFGGLLRAYELVGFTPGRDYRYLEINRVLRRMYPQIVSDVVNKIEQLGGSVERDPGTDLMTVNEELTTSLVIARCGQTSAGSQRWRIRLDISLRPDITVALRMDQENRQPLDYYLLPRIDMPAARIKLAEDNALFLDAYRYDSLDYFFHMTSRINVRAAA